MREMVRTLRDNWSVIAGAPWAFAIVAGLMSGLIWIVLKEFSKRQIEGLKHQIENLEARLKLRDDEIADYKRKLQGATPKEAGERIAELERQVLELQPKQRSLTQDQKACIGRHVAGNALPNDLLNIIYVGSSPESAIYAHDFKEALSLGGWSVEPDTVLFGSRVMNKGLTLAQASSDEHKTVSKILATALRKADVEFKEERNENLADVRLYIDMFH